MNWPAIGFFALVVLGSYLGAKFTIWILTGGPTGLGYCFLEPDKPCSPDKCECWEWEQEKRRAYLEKDGDNDRKGN